MAYTLHFAPKHAVIWRCIAKEFFSNDNGVFKLNSIGTGPGSEIFGAVCGLDDTYTLDVQIVGLECEEAWRDIFEIARDEFNTRTGILIDGFMTKDSANLLPDGLTIGSFVLTDAARRGDARTLVDSILRKIEHRKAYFLDFNSYQTSGGVSAYTNNAIKQDGITVSQDKLNKFLKVEVTTAIRDEMSSCSPLYCSRPVKDNLPLWHYTVERI